MATEAAAPIKIGVIGAGRIGQVHARSINQMNGADLAMIADPFEQFGKPAAAEFNTKWEPDWETMVADDSIRGIVIGSPTPFHADQIIKSAEAGKDIFCEKPISNDLATIDRCLEVVKSCNVRLLIGFQRRFDSNFNKIRDTIKAGVIGDVRTFAIVSRDPAPPPAEYLEKSGGIFLDQASHDFDMARYVTGSEIESVYVTGAAFEEPAQKADDLDTVITVLKMKDGSFGTIKNSRRCGWGYDQRVEVFGSKGSVEGNNKNPDTVVISTEDSVSHGTPYSFFMDRYADAYSGAMEAFVTMIRDGSDPPVTGADGRAPIVAAKAADLSKREGRPVMLSECDI